MVFLSGVTQGQDEDSPHANLSMRAVYGSSYSRTSIPRQRLPEEEMPPNVAYQFIKDELALDGTPSLNLASFVTTYMEPEAEKLIAENAAKNFIDYEEYPMTAELQSRCVNMIGRLLNAPIGDDEAALGVSTIGSSEAIILATLAMKRRWQESRRAAGKPTDKPNLVMGSNVQVCWEKAVRYLEIETREVYCEEDYLFMNPDKAIKLVDENTIGVVVILGSTYTGHYEDAEKMDTLLQKFNKENNLEVPIHIDAASGGFVAPFVAPDLKWDFRLPTVVSINLSGHKYGLCYAGIGWNIWRGKKYLPEDLIFHINYLGADQASFTLNFSKAAAPVIAQYYVLIRMGFAGFKAVMSNLYLNATYLAKRLQEHGFHILSTDQPEKGLPVVAFRMKPETSRHFDEFDIAHTLRERGWIVPAYTMAPHAQSIKLLRLVLREDFSRNRCELLLHDLLAAYEHLKEHDHSAIEARRNAKSRWSSLLSAMPKRSEEKRLQEPRNGHIC